MAPLGALGRRPWPPAVSAAPSARACGPSLPPRPAWQWRRLPALAPTFLRVLMVLLGHSPQPPRILNLIPPATTPLLGEGQSGTGPGIRHGPLWGPLSGHHTGVSQAVTLREGGREPCAGGGHAPGASVSREVQGRELAGDRQQTSAARGGALGRPGGHVQCQCVCRALLARRAMARLAVVCPSAPG